MSAIEVIAILALSGNFLQFWFWAFQIQRLIDKVMSRNYAEYVQTKAFLKAAEKNQKSPAPEQMDDDVVLHELNARLAP